MMLALKIASWLPEWVYGRELLVKWAVAYAIINGMSRASKGR